MNELWIVRHGSTEWSASGRHTSRTDIALSDEGRAEVSALAPVLNAHPFAAVLTSPRVRARDTAALAGFPKATVDGDLAEWDYGELEGCTTPEIRARGPEWRDWTIFTGAVPGGETIEDVARRARRVLAVVDAAPGDVLCFGHAHMSRVLAAVALGLDACDGARFALDPATINVVGAEREIRALRRWNAKL